MNQQTIEGVGLGLRFEHFDDIIESKPTTPWFEVITEDFLNLGPHHDYLESIRRDKPIAMHSVAMNLGGVDPIDSDYLKSFKQVYDKFQPEWISDHLCWSAHGGKYHHDLLPIPRTKQALDNVCERIDYIQSYFNRELCIENITTYVDFDQSEFEEIDFIRTIRERTGCFLLLDVTNVLINHKNRNLNPENYFNQFPLEFVKQIHLSGYIDDPDLVIDSHSNTVRSEDIEFYKSILQKGYSIPVMIERDTEIPPFAALESERQSLVEVIGGA